MEKKRLLAEGLIKLFSGIVLTFVLLFLPAGDLMWKNGWILMGVLFLPMFIAGIIMFVKAPDLLRRRLQAKESEDVQKGVIAWSGVMFLAAFIIAGLNHRFHFCRFPGGAVTFGIIVFLLAYLMFGEVLRENAYLSRTIEVSENQKVIDTGLYGIVRHPMYTATIFLFLSMPLILDSPISFVIMLGYLPLIITRIKNEEEVLERELQGYTDYKKRVRYRLVPFIW